MTSDDLPTNTIVLTPAQMAYAAETAARLHDALRRKGIKDAHGLKGTREDLKALETTGARAELAVSLALGVAWTSAENPDDPFGPDVGSRTQVRATHVPRPSHSLIVRPRDFEKYGLDVPFVLVFASGNAFTLLGWLLAREALTRGRVWNGGDRTRPDAWFVPQEKLRPIGELENP